MRSCCQTGVCATHLAEGRADYSTIVVGDTLALAPNTGSQELVGALMRALINKGAQHVG